MNMNVWFLLGCLFVLLEIGHPGLLYFLALAIGCLGAFIASWVQYSLGYQYLIFFVTSGIGIVLVSRLAKYVQVRNTGHHRSNTDLLIGQTVTVVAVQSTKVGHGLLGGETWLIKLQGDGELSVGQVVVVQGIQGCHLQVSNLLSH